MTLLIRLTGKQLLGPTAGPVATGHSMDHVSLSVADVNRSAGILRIAPVALINCETDLNASEEVEAGVGIEPAYAELQFYHSPSAFLIHINSLDHFPPRKNLHFSEISSFINQHVAESLLRIFITICPAIVSQ